MRSFAGFTEEPQHDQQVIDPHNSIGVNIRWATFGVAPENGQRGEQVSHIPETVVVDIAKTKGARDHTSSTLGRYVVPVMIGDLCSFKQAQFGCRCSKVHAEEGLR